MKFVVRWAFRLLILLVVLVVALVLLKDTIIKAVAERSIRSETGLEARIGRFEVGLLSPTLTIADFTLYNAASFGGGPFVVIPELHVEYDRAAVASRKLHLTLVRFNLGQVNIVQSNDGTWTQQQRVVPTDPLVSGFGLSVAVQNDSLLVGAPFTGSTTIFKPGSAFVFTRQGGVWNQQAQLDPVDQVPAGLYGLCVSLDGNTVVGGAQRPCEAEIFVNNNGTWSLQAIINGPDDSDFGTSVKVIGDLVMVTAYDDLNPSSVQTGDAFIYTRGGSTWTEQPDLYMAPGFNGIPGSGQVGQRFGNFATMTKAGSQTIFIIGSQTYSNPDALRVGAVYTAILH